MSAPFDRIFLNDIRVGAAVGADVAERRVHQELRIDIELAVDMSAARRFDRLDATVDYDDLHGRILSVVRERPIALLEHLGESILAEITQNELILWAKVEIAKPGLFAGATPRVALMGRRPTRVAIGLGANLGDARTTIAQAVEALACIGSCVARSSLYRTKPWGVLDQPDFFNAAVILETTLLPHAVLAALKTIERRFGRTVGARYGPRVLDCDLLDDAGSRITDAELIVPHPRLEERAFVLAPLAEISPLYRAAYERLPEDERLSVARLAEWPDSCANPSLS